MKERFKDRIISILLFLITMGIFSFVIVFVIIGIKEFSGENEEVAMVENVEENNTISKGKTVENKIEVPQIVENPINKIDKTNQNQVDNYSKVQIDKYFYNQLDEKSRIIYRAFESNKEQMKTGTYQI